MKKSVKLSLADLSVEKLLTLADSVGTSMAGNARFPSPPVVIADLVKANDDLRAVHAKAVLSRSKVDFAEERSMVIVVGAMLRQLGDYVEMIANGDENIILSAGMPASKTREKNPVPGQVNQLVASFTGIPGSIAISWKRPQYSKYFRVYMSADPESGNWQLVDTISSRKMMVQNLASGKRFYFKVVPVGTAGIGPDSEIAEAIAA
jgi:hypothetical protein